MNFNDLILLLDSRSENLKQLASMEVPIKVSGLGTEYYKTKEGYRLEYENGIIEYIDNNDRLHRTDGPAFEHPDGYKEWYVNGEQMTGEQFNRWRAKHNPIKESRSENLKHLSSMEIPYLIDRGTEYYKTEDGYRVEWHDGIIWYDWGWLIHRTDGPAVEYDNGDTAWYINNKKMSEEQFNQWRAKNNPIKESRIENIKQLASMEMPYKVDDDGTETYKTKDGYRVESAVGNIFWFNNNGERHRVDGPAVEFVDGSKYWYVNNKQHRIDGPAYIGANGTKIWYVNGKEMRENTFDKWRAKHNPIKESRIENIKQLASMEVPFRVDNRGNELYKTKDGYRVEFSNGNSGWYLTKGKKRPTLHRLDGPAIEWANGSTAWYIDGKKMSERQFNRWRAKNNLLNEL